MTKAEVQKWLDTIPADHLVAIDDGGLALVELEANGTQTGAYLEIGGEPRDDEEDEPADGPGPA